MYHRFFLSDIHRLSDCFSLNRETPLFWGCKHFPLMSQLGLTTHLLAKFLHRLSILDTCTFLIPLFPSPVPYIEEGPIEVERLVFDIACSWVVNIILHGKLLASSCIFGDGTLGMNILVKSRDLPSREKSIFLTISL